MQRQYFQNDIIKCNLYITVFTTNLLLTKVHMGEGNPA